MMLINIPFDRYEQGTEISMKKAINVFADKKWSIKMTFLRMLLDISMRTKNRISLYVQRRMKHSEFSCQFILRYSRKSHPTLVGWGSSRRLSHLLRLPRSLISYGSLGIQVVFVSHKKQQI